MDYELLVEFKTFGILYSLPKRTRFSIEARLHELTRSPDRFSDYTTHDAIGRLIDVTLVGGYAVRYWTDFSDRQVRVMAILPADR